MSTCNFIPRTVEASLDARLAPFHGIEPRSALEDLDVEASRAVAPRQERPRLSLVKDLKAARKEIRNRRKEEGGRR